MNGGPRVVVLEQCPLTASLDTSLVEGGSVSSQHFPGNFDFVGEFAWRDPEFGMLEEPENKFLSETYTLDTSLGFRRNTATYLGPGSNDNQDRFPTPPWAGLKPALNSDCYQYETLR